MHVVVNIVAALMILGLAALGLVLAYLAASCQCECTVEEGRSLKAAHSAPTEPRPSCTRQTIKEPWFEADR